MDENRILRRTEDKAGACDRHDSIGQNVREKQNCGHY